jgi:hypothetical protein
MKLLAGLLDSDGYLNKEGNCFEFIHNNENMIDDIIFLARSLGFACYKSEKKTSWKYKEINFSKTYRINISGSGIEKIPTKRIIEINVMFSFINSLDDIYKLIVYFFL